MSTDPKTSRRGACKVDSKFGSLGRKSFPHSSRIRKARKSNGWPRFSESEYDDGLKNEPDDEEERKATDGLFLCHGVQAVSLIPKMSTFSSKGQ